MAVTTVEEVTRRVRVVLQDIAEVARWPDDELVGWLNESYQAIVSTKPNASAVNEAFVLESGTKQALPEAGLSLIDVVRNTAGDSNGGTVSLVSRQQINAARRRWHRDEESLDIQHFIFDELDPRHFYVYPPAAHGAEVEIIYSQVPGTHGAYDESKGESIKLDDSYAPAILDYILYRAHSKDADFSANANRAAAHYQAFNLALGRKAKLDVAISPNNPQVLA